MSAWTGDVGRELVIRNGLVVDGTGNEPFEADVLVRGDEIVEVDVGIRCDPDMEVDAASLVVAPGFIDVHTHADQLAFLAPGYEELRRGAVLQGVTTVVVGNCGFSVFPIPQGEGKKSVQDHLAAMFGEEVRTFVDLEHYAADLLASGLDTNLGTLVGHGTLRAAVMGFEDREPTDNETERMVSLGAKAFDQGAVGVSTGLIYPPGSYAETQELVQLARVAAEHRRIYVTHMRHETNGVVEALQEAIEIGRRAAVPVQISHLKAAARPNHGRLPYLLEMIDAVAEDGQDITADAYPYERASTVLHALLPRWATEGGITAMLARLADPAERERVRADFDEPPRDWQNFIEGGSWDDVTIASAPRTSSLEGRTVGEAAATSGRDPVDVVADLLIAEHGSVTVTVEMVAHDDVTSCLGSSRVMVGSDGIPVPGTPHPRWAGSFARVLSRGGRERFGLSLEEAVRKVTGLPARRFGLQGLGVVDVGHRADLVIFDESEIEDRATYREPLRSPSGIEHVFIGGRHVIDHGVDGGKRAGRVLAGSSA